MAAETLRESLTQEESLRPAKRQKLDAFMKMAKPDYVDTAPGLWQPHELKTMFKTFGPEVITYAKAAAYLHAYKPGFAELQERYHNMQLMSLDEAEDGVRAGYSNDKIKPKAALCTKAIEVLDEIQKATKMAQNMPTYYEAVEMRAAFAMVLVNTQENHSQGAKAFVNDIHEILRELVEILEERHGRTKDFPRQAISPLVTNKVPAKSSPVMATDAAMFRVTTNAVSGDSRNDEYLKERVKDHIVDLVSTTIMDWNDLQGIDDVKEALESQYDDMLSMLDAKSEDEIEMDALLLHGEQGTGKTSVAYSFAKRHGIQMYSLNSTIIGSLPGETCK